MALELAAIGASLSSEGEAGLARQFARPGGADRVRTLLERCGRLSAEGLAALLEGLYEHTGPTPTRFRDQLAEPRPEE